VPDSLYLLMMNLAVVILMPKVCITSLKGRPFLTTYLTRAIRFYVKWEVYLDRDVGILAFALFSLILHNQILSNYYSS
jgi:hypothetical protein